MWEYTEALKSLHQVIEKAGDDPSEVGLHSLRIAAVTALAAGGEVPQGVTQTGRLRSPDSSKLYTRSNPEDGSILLCELPETGKIEQSQPGQGAAWGRNL